MSPGDGAKWRPKSTKPSSGTRCPGLSKLDSPKLLVSIRSAREAKFVQDAEIGILDVKEPNQGGLGASDPGTLKEIADFVGQSDPNRILSFSAGELAHWFPQLDGKDDGRGLQSDRQLVQRYGAELLCQYRYVKIGLAESFPPQATGQSKQVYDWSIIWTRFFDGLPTPTKAVAVVYLDFQHCAAPPPADVIRVAARTSNCDVVLFDTFHKSGNLFSHVSITKLKEMVLSARGQGLKAVVAGSVDLGCLAEVAAVGPDFIGVRGAVCSGERTSEIESVLVDEFAQELNAAVLKNSVARANEHLSK